MFKLKSVYPYLGRTEALLDARAVARCSGSTVGGGEAEQLPEYIGNVLQILPANDRVQPVLAKLTTTTGMVFYRNINDATKLYHKIVVLNDLLLSQEAEVTLLSTTEQNIEAFAAVGLADNKVCLAYKLSNTEDLWVRIGNVTGINTVFGDPVSVNTSMYPDLDWNQLELRKVTSGKVVISAPTTAVVNSPPTALDTSATKTGVQVIEIDGSDAITYGTVYETPWGDAIGGKIAVCDTTLGMIVTAPGDRSNNSPLCTLASFSITGKVITFNTENDYWNTSQVTSGTDKRFLLYDIAPTSTTKAMAYGGAYVFRSASDKDIGYGAFVATDATGTTTSTTKLIDEDTVVRAGVPTAEPVATIVAHNSKVVVLMAIRDAYPFQILIAEYGTVTTTPTRVSSYAFSTEMADVACTPDIISMGAANLLLGAFTHRVGSTYQTKMFIASIT